MRNKYHNIRTKDFHSRNKYHNTRSKDFHSKREERRYQELLLLERGGHIKDLRRQVKYVLVETQRGPSPGPFKSGPRKGQPKPGPLLENEVAYYADFVYVNTETGETVVEDSKGFRTPEYIIKRKLMLKNYGVRIYET